MANRETLDQAAITAEELYYATRVVEYSGRRTYVECARGQVSEYHAIDEDEVAIIEERRVLLKELLPDDVVRGFNDMTHVMKYIIGEAPLPDPEPEEGSGGVRILTPC